MAPRWRIGPFRAHDRWLILAEGHRLRWGGDLRRSYIFRDLARRTQGTLVDGWSHVSIRSTARAASARGSGTVRVASAELLTDEALDALRSVGEATVLDVHDDVLLQADAIGLQLSAGEVAAATTQRGQNLAAFQWLVVPSAQLGALLGLDPSRTIVAGNGTDPDVVRPGTWPDELAVGLVSGAGPGRGIEAVVEATRVIRVGGKDVKLLLWLAATGPASSTYLDQLRESVRAEAWIEFGTAPYSEIGVQLARASVLVVPTPAHRYWDAVAPIKLFDCLAAGRPLVVTPRPTPAEIVDRHGAGVVTEDDSPEALADAIGKSLADPGFARLAGARGRQAAEREYSWAAIGASLATELLRRVS
jgi:glycosyltransferase involved in cell wall biosynthesis